MISETRVLMQAVSNITDKILKGQGLDLLQMITVNFIARKYQNNLIH